MPFDYKELTKIQKMDKHIYARLVLTIISGILLGGYAGKKMAQFLEICDLFTPDIVENDD